MKQQTLEEVAEERYGNMPFGSGLERRSLFIEGGKWQQENIPIQILDVDNIYAHIENGVVIIEKNDKSKISFSEEKIIQILIKFNQEIQEVEDVRGWFTQFKK
jgi:hypothetical protein